MIESWFTAHTAILWTVSYALEFLGFYFMWAIYRKQTAQEDRIERELQDREPKG